MTVATVIRVLNILLVLGCLGGLSPAIVHARDDVDRLYLVGTALILSAIAAGSAVHLRDPFGWPILITMLGETVLLVAARKSRQRRLRGGGRA
jgi:hypothetical protein